MSNNIKKKSLKALLLDDELEVNSFLPKKVVDDIDSYLLNKINAASAIGDDEKMYNVCFYGHNNTGAMPSFVGREHEPGPPRSETLFKRLVY